MRRFRVRRKVADQEKQQSDAEAGHDARDAAAAGQVDQEQLQYLDAEHDRSAQLRRMAWRAQKRMSTSALALQTRDSMACTNCDAASAPKR